MKQLLDRGPVLAALHRQSAHGESRSRNGVATRQSEARQPQVRLAPIALSDRTGEVEFTISDSNLGESGLDTPGTNKLRVPCKTLLDLLRDEKVTRVDGMKIDVEGVEDMILTPFFQQADRSLFPGFIVIENSANRWRSDLLSVLTRVGYRQHGAHKMNLILVLERPVQVL